MSITFDKLFLSFSVKNGTYDVMTDNGQCIFFGTPEQIENWANENQYTIHELFLEKNYD